jgi:hypothetical protein
MPQPRPARPITRLPYLAQGVAQVPVTDADGRGVWQSAGVTAGNRGLPGLRAGWPVKTRMTAVPRARPPAGPAPGARDLGARLELQQ